jgi:hypothetical protein
MKQKSYTRYHRYDTQGKKYIKRFELGVEPSDKVIEGFGPWIRGTGPFAPEALYNVTQGIRKACTGVPKTAEQKQKMREAKLGVPKSQEHKDNMRRSWYRRKELLERYIVDEIQSSSTTSATSIG